MDSARIKVLQELASDARKDIVRMVGVARSGSIETPLSVTDVLVFLYCEAISAGPGESLAKGRDCFLLGMGAATPALYAVLARRGYFDREELWHYKRLGAMLQPLPDFRRVPGIDAPCVLSASEVSILAGLAETLRADGVGGNIFCLIEKADCANPDFWSEIENIGKKGLRGIVLLINTPVEAGEPEKEEIVRYVEKFNSFSWKVLYADGHDFADLERAFSSLCSGRVSPGVVFVSTQCGKGISNLEKQRVKYSRQLSLQEMDSALEELENGR